MLRQNQPHTVITTCGGQILPGYNMRESKLTWICYEIPCRLIHPRCRAGTPSIKA